MVFLSHFGMLAAKEFRTGGFEMPALRCPSCGYSDLHAVDVELIKLNAKALDSLEREHQQELACKRCGWTPSKQAHPNALVGVEPIDRNI
jgi:hypothetical protein